MRPATRSFPEVNASVREEPRGAQDEVGLYSAGVQPGGRPGVMARGGRRGWGDGGEDTRAVRGLASGSPAGAGAEEGPQLTGAERAAATEVRCSLFLAEGGVWVSLAELEVWGPEMASSPAETSERLWIREGIPCEEKKPSLKIPSALLSAVLSNDQASILRASQPDLRDSPVAGAR